MAPNAARFGKTCGPGLRVVGFQRRVTVAFVVEPERVVILRLFYGGANWADELARDDAG
jgi:toxin ParE1/3/4